MVPPTMGWVFQHQGTIRTIPKDMPKGQPDLDNLPLKLSSKLILGCIRQTVKIAQIRERPKKVAGPFRSRSIACIYIYIQG